MNSTQLFNLTIYNKSKENLLTELKSIVDGIHLKKTTILFTPNAEQIVQAEKDAEFKKNLQQADILIPDGMSVVLALKKKNKVPYGYKKQKNGEKNIADLERIAGVDVVTDLLQMAEHQFWKIAVIGGQGYEDDFVASNKIPKTAIWTSGYKNISNPTEQEEQKLVDFIKIEKPDIVFVAFGAPFQEKWIVEHRDLLEENGVKLAMAVGGSFDFILGKVSRAPEWMQKAGLEWFYRLVKQPWRWKRQVRLVEFWWRVACMN